MIKLTFGLVLEAQILAVCKIQQAQDINLELLLALAGRVCSIFHKTLSYGLEHAARDLHSKLGPILKNTD